MYFLELHIWPQQISHGLFHCLFGGYCFKSSIWHQALLGFKVGFVPSSLRWYLQSYLLPICKTRVLISTDHNVLGSGKFFSRVKYLKYPSSFILLSVNLISGKLSEEKLFKLYINSISLLLTKFSTSMISSGKPCVTGMLESWLLPCIFIFKWLR